MIPNANKQSTFLTFSGKKQTKTISTKQSSCLQTDSSVPQKTFQLLILHTDLDYQFRNNLPLSLKINFEHLSNLPWEKNIFSKRQKFSLWKWSQQLQVGIQYQPERGQKTKSHSIKCSHSVGNSNLPNHKRFSLWNVFTQTCNNTWHQVCNFLYINVILSTFGNKYQSSLLLTFIWYI